MYRVLPFEVIKLDLAKARRAHHQTAACAAACGGEHSGQRQSRPPSHTRGRTAPLSALVAPCSPLRTRPAVWLSAPWPDGVEDRLPHTFERHWEWAGAQPAAAQSTDLPGVGAGQRLLLAQPFPLQRTASRLEAPRRPPIAAPVVTSMFRVGSKGSRRGGRRRCAFAVE